MGGQEQRAPIGRGRKENTMREKGREAFTTRTRGDVRLSRLVAGSIVAAALVAPHAPAQCSLGSWTGAFDHPFSAPFVCHGADYTQMDPIHMSLIPKGGKRGWVIVWGGEKAYEGNGQGEQRGLSTA